MEPREDRKGKRLLEIRNRPIQRQRKSASQMKILEDAFFFNRYPSREVKQKLTESTGLAFRQVEHWFADQRYKFQRKNYENYNDVQEENRMLMSSKLGSNTALGSILSSFHALDDGLSTTITTIRHKKLQPMQLPKAQKLSFLQTSLASRSMQQHQQLLRQHMMRSQTIEALLGQQDMETSYNGTTCERQQIASLKAVTNYLNSKNCFTLSTSSTGLVPKIQSAGMFHHLNGGSRDIHEYQFFPEHTAICSSESTGRDGAIENLHEGRRAVHEFQFFPKQPSMLSEKE